MDHLMRLCVYVPPLPLQEVRVVLRLIHGDNLRGVGLAYSVGPCASVEVGVLSSFVAGGRSVQAEPRRTAHDREAHLEAVHSNLHLLCFQTEMEDS